MSTASNRVRLGAYRLLVQLLYGQFRYIEVLPRGVLRVTSIYKVARSLGTESNHVRAWLVHLENLGYLESLSWAPNRQAAQFRLRPPSNASTT